MIVTNRSAEKADRLAAAVAAEARAFEQLDSLLIEADILLTSTGAKRTAIVTEVRFKGLLRRNRPDCHRGYRGAAGCGRRGWRALPNVYLYNVDDLQQVAAGNKGKRDLEIAAATALLHTHVEEFLKWFAARDVGPLVKALYEQSHATARAELEAMFARNPGMTAEQRAEMERLTHRLVGKLLHGPVTKLTTQAETTARPMLAAAIKKLFDLNG